MSIQQNKIPSRARQKTNKKLAVRLRLKRSPQYSRTNQLLLRRSRSNQFDNPQLGPVQKKLKQQNAQLNKNINQLWQLNLQNINRNNKNWMETVLQLGQQKTKEKSQNLMHFVRDFRKALQILKNQGELIAQLSPRSNHQNQRQNIQNIGQKYQNQTQKQSIVITKNNGEPTQQTNKNILDTPANCTSSYLPKTTATNSSYISLQQHNKILTQVNNQLKSQTTQMQHYIIILKQQLNQKDNNLIKLREDYNTLQKQKNKLKQLCQWKDGQCKILKEEVVGYQNKIQELEAAIKELVDQAQIYQSRVMGQEKDDYDEDLVNQPSNNKKQSQVEQYIPHNHHIHLQKLQQIYQKTDQTLKKSKKLQSQLIQKQFQIKILSNKLLEILENINSSNYPPKQPILQNLLQLDISSQIQTYLQKKQQHFIQTQHNFQQMLSHKLDLIISQIKNNSPQQQQQQQQKQPPQITALKRQYTIIDKINFIHEILQYMMKVSPQAINNPSLGTLLILSNKLEQIMDRSEDFKVQLTRNNNRLLEVCGVLEGMDFGNGDGMLGNTKSDVKEKSNLDKNVISSQIQQKLDTLQKLLKQNQELLDNQQSHSIAQQKSIQIKENIPSQIHPNNKGNKVADYIQQLQQVIIKIQQNNNNCENHKKCQKQYNKIKSQYQSIIALNSQIQGKLSQIIRRKVNNLTQIEQIMQQIYKIVNIIKANQHNMQIQSLQIHQKPNSPNKQAQSSSQITQKQQQKIKQQSQKLKNKYFTNQAQFVQKIFNKMLSLRKLNQKQFFLVVQQIFQDLQNRDIKFRQQMGRRKQILKQRTAAISQICKQGMKDSSLEGSVRLGKKQ